MRGLHYHLHVVGYRYYAVFYLGWKCYVAKINTAILIT